MMPAQPSTYHVHIWDEAAACALMALIDRWHTGDLTGAAFVDAFVQCTTPVEMDVEQES